MKSKPSKNPSLILRQKIIVPDNVGICIGCGVESVSIKGDDDNEEKKDDRKSINDPQ